MPIRQDGPVTVGTRRNLIDGLRSRPMPEAAVDAALAQSTAFAEKLVEKYSESIAPGEVGIDGSGRVGNTAIRANKPPTLLLYGRVQSGKTAAMILTTALSLDNGFRVIIVLTSDNLILVDQTASRFKALSGPRVFSTKRQDGTYEWEGLQDEIAEEVPTDGLVLVCQKNDRHLGQIMTFLQQIDAASFPTIIFDDEADAASPDTTVAARAIGRVNAPTIASAIEQA